LIYLYFKENKPYFKTAGHVHTVYKNLLKHSAFWVSKLFRRAPRRHSCGLFLALRCSSI